MLPAETPEIDIDQLAEAVSAGAAIVDVREPGEYAAGHVARSGRPVVGGHAPRA